MRWVVAVAFLATAPEQVEAQRLVPPFARVEHQYRQDVREAPLSIRLFPQAADHRYEGALVGIVLVGGGAALLGHGLCESSELNKKCGWETIKFGLVGSFAGGIAGALIGAAFPKRARS